MYYRHDLFKRLLRRTLRIYASELEPKPKPQRRRGRPPKNAVMHTQDLIFAEELQKLLLLIETMSTIGPASENLKALKIIQVSFIILKIQLF